MKDNIEVLIKIPENTYKQIQALARNGYFDHDICGNAMRRIANGTPLPENATNGDMIKTVFPNIKVEYIKKLSGMNYYQVSGMDAFGSTKTNGMDVFGSTKTFYEDWWNAPYKPESEDTE